MNHLPDLPVMAALPELERALREYGVAVLVAPPGAGKTTLVPLMLLRQKLAPAGRIILVEPRRIAARAAARRMAGLLHETVGQTVGYAVRFETLSSERTRILVVTDGVFSRMALNDPELSGIDVVLFDEFHERSLDVDYGLALAIDIREALRPDLKLAVMSATLDASPVAKLLGHAPIIESQGRSFPVELRYMPRKPGARIEDAVVPAIRIALRETSGSILVFLPGRAEIGRIMERFVAPAGVDLLPLHGDLDGAEQDAAIRPSENGRRKVVLATSIAESSITIDGVRIVIDSGLSRLPRFEPATGLTRLETVRVSRASADQRAGRAGRTAPGTAFRLWHEGQNAALPPAPPPAILEADLSGLLLDCAAFGIDPNGLRLINPPPAAALSEARQGLVLLKALDENGRLTKKGEAMRRLPVSPRLAAMIVHAGEQGAARQAAELALLVGERGLGGQGVDLEQRLARFRDNRGRRARDASALARRLAKLVQDGPDSNTLSPGCILAEAFPDRIAQARGQPGQYRLANGRGAQLDETDPLAIQPWLVVADLTGKAASARIQAAAAVRLEEIEKLAPSRIETAIWTTFDLESGSLRRRGQRRLGALILSESMLPPPTGGEADAAMIAAVRAHGLELLSWSLEARSILARLGWLRRVFGEPWPEVDEPVLLEQLEKWLLPFLSGSSNIAAIKGVQIEAGLRSLLPYELQRELESLAPRRFVAPTETRVPIRYDGEAPAIAICVQELYGLREHPAIAKGKVPLLLELLSPAGRPVQLTKDLPGFWSGSWKEVRIEMRGRYPKHFWPEKPEESVPTTRARSKQL